MRVHEIDDLAELIECRSLWDSLLPQTPGASFFHSLDWLECYWRHFGTGQRLRVLVVSGDAGPVGILPLVVRREATRVGRVRVLTWPLDGWGSFYGPIGPDPTATLLGGLAYVRRRRRDWDLLDLRWIDSAGNDRQRTPMAMRSAGFQADERTWECTAQIDLKAGWDAYWAGRTSKFRNNVRRHERRLAERGELSYTRYRPQGECQGDGDPRWDLYEACLEVARQSWQATSATGTTLSHAAVDAFLRDMHATAARTGALDLNLLSIAGQPVAFAYNYHYAGYVFGLRVGFNAEAGRDGAGTVLYMRAIEDSCLRGDHTYDMGPGSLEIKQQLLTHTVTTKSYTHFAALAPRAQLLRLKRLSQRFYNKPPATSADQGEAKRLTVAAGTGERS